MSRLRRPPAWVAALAVFVVSGAALSALHHTPRLLLPKASAVSAVAHDSQSAATLRHDGWDHASVEPLDTELERVSFYKGPQIQFQAALSASGKVVHTYAFAGRPVPYGNPIAYEPGMLLGL